MWYSDTGEDLRTSMSNGVLNAATGLKTKGCSVVNVNGCKKESPKLFDRYNRSMDAKSTNQDKLEIKKTRN